MVVFPNAKINLGLNILQKRPDGYHELESCFYPVMWRDGLEIIEASETKMTSSGITIPDDGENIVLKAYYLLKNDFDLPPVQMHLHKVIPIGAGLGGGSADAAFTLKLLNDLFSLDLNESQLEAYAAQLGADCAFFIKNKPAVAAGIGEKLDTVDLSLSGKFLLLVYPGLHISTREAYASITPKMPEKDLRDVLIKSDITKWQEYLVNDFEEPIVKKYPALEQLKQKLIKSGATYASMSGSGSCFYGIFEKEVEINFPETYITWSEEIR